jgi:DNA-directed RNA polymerase subunit F
MIGKKTLETNPIPMAKVKEILTDFSGQFDLSYEQNLTLDYVNKFSKLSLEDSEKLVSELEDKKIKRKLAIKITDVLPEDLADLRLLFAKESIVSKKKNMDELLEVINKYRDKVIKD